LAQKPEYKVFAVLITDIKKTLTLKKYIDPVIKIPAEYHKNLKAFSRKKTDKLSKHRLYNHKINLKPEK